MLKLEEGGYFKGLPPAKVEALKQVFEQQGWMGIFHDSRRFFLADAENLAEGGLGPFIQEVEPFLTMQGVTLPEIQDDITGNSYTVRVGGVSHEIYDATEVERDNPCDQPGVIWALSMTRGFRIVDELLAAVGSSERVYAVNGGNDLFAFFLTPELHQTVMEHPEASPEGGPYKPTEDYPWFGQPHDE